MRLDPKYFVRFMAICAGLTVVVIAWSTFRYQDSQERTFRNNLEEADLDLHYLHLIAEPGRASEPGSGAEPGRVSEPGSGSGDGSGTAAHHSSGTGNDLGRSAGAGAEPGRLTGSGPSDESVIDGPGLLDEPGRVSESDSLQISELIGSPVVIDFWATWSNRSQSVHRELGQLVQTYPDLKVLAVAVRDGESQIRSYIEDQPYPFTWLTGTELYHDLQVPGLPSHILIDRSGRVFDYQVGEDSAALVQKIESLLQHEPQ